MHTLHDNHPGIRHMKSLAQLYVCWLPIDKMIENWVKNCRPCQINQNMPNAALSYPWERTLKPWVRVHLDFASPFLRKMYIFDYCGLFYKMGRSSSYEQY